MTANLVNSVQILSFSPTGSTRRIVEAVAKGTGIPEAAPISITTPQERDSFSGRIDGDLLIVGVPVYLGTIPSLVLSPLSKVDGTDRWALPVAVCGNVRMGTCLAELCAILKCMDQVHQPPNRSGTSCPFCEKGHGRIDGSRG